MSRGYQPEDQLDPRVSSDGRDPNAGEPPKVDEVREQAINRCNRNRARTPGSAPPSKTRTVSRTSRPNLSPAQLRSRNDGGTRKISRSGEGRSKEFVYGGNDDRMRPDVENLVRQGLVEMKSIPHEETGSHQLLTLTKNGHRFLTQTQSAGKEQALYHGFTKPREAHHDADLYRLYQKAAEEDRKPGRPKPSRRSRLRTEEAALPRSREARRRIANPPKPSAPSPTRTGFKVVRGKIPVPDVRIEYETREGERARVDLEFATGHYRGRNLAEKVRAGFSIYARADEVSKLQRVLDQRELTAEILSL